MKQKRSIIVRLTPQNFSIMYGVFALNASRWRESFNNIYGEFQTDADLKLSEIPVADNLFFYGNRHDLEKALEGEKDIDERIRRLFDGDRLVASYVRVNKYDRSHGDGWIRASLEEIEIEDRKREFLEEVFGFYAEFLQSLKGNVSRSSEAQGLVHRGIMANLRRFPPRLLELFEASGVLYKANKSDYLSYKGRDVPASESSLQIPGRTKHRRPIKL